ncbi:hypothetical protein [Sphingomonas sp.]|jgi:hypothetical protein|uniref:AbiTii domain-containing protein n=1 Tax=Sphingomonas sp. TaxID=28214 RepID=UPI00262E1FAA|nr:hypothetical protein [Sphingomonas sp.]MDF2603492.1 hypothetical protein [Sphingomonas sp.]
MSGLVDQLQADALSADVPVSTLLRKTKLAAVKLGLNDALEWVEGELNGYRGDDLPKYRRIGSTLEGMDRYRNAMPIVIGDEKMDAMLREVELREPIGNYESILARSTGEGQISMMMDVGVVQRMNEAFDWDLVQVRQIIPHGSLTGIIDRVRNMVLDWAIELERAGITGEGLVFSPAERQKAASASIHIGTFHGSFNAGDASGAGSSIVQSTNLGGEHAVFGQIAQAVKAQVTSEHDQQAIVREAEAMRAATTAVERLSAYQRLITAAADHMTVLTPFLPALTALLKG